MGTHLTATITALASASPTEWGVRKSGRAAGTSLTQGSRSPQMPFTQVRTAVVGGQAGVPGVSFKGRKESSSRGRLETTEPQELL